MDSAVRFALSVLSTLQLIQVRQILSREEEPDGPSLPRNPLNETVGFQGKDHLVHGRRAHAKVSLHVGLGGRTAVDPAVVMNERQILPLFAREGFCRHKASVPFSIDVPVKTGHRCDPVLLTPVQRKLDTGHMRCWEGMRSLKRPPYGRRRAPFQAPSKQNNHPITTNPTPLEVLLLLPRKATSQSS